MLRTSPAPRSTASARVRSDLTVTTTRMWCDKTRYSVSGMLQPGEEACLVSADGTVHATDVNRSTSPRATRLDRFLSADHTLVLVCSRAKETSAPAPELE